MSAPKADVLAAVFQLAHCVGEADFLDGEREVENDWAEHQVATTVDFAPANAVLGWYLGGLNFQVEHHLFPSMARNNVRTAHGMVRDYCAEIGVPYHETSLVGSYRELLGFLHEVGAPLRAGAPSREPIRSA